MTAARSADNTSSEQRSDRDPFVTLIALLGIAAIPWRIFRLGYLPLFDDALADAAKAASGRPWTDVIVLRDVYSLDPHIGWHALLRGVHLALGTSAYGLLVTAFIGLFLLVMLLPLAWLRRPEAWLITVLVTIASGNDFVERFLIGRPFMITMAALMSLLWLWERRSTEAPSRAMTACMAALIAASVLLHGSWYLWLMPLGAFWVAGQRAWARALGLALIAGVFVGAVLTLHPVGYLVESVRMGYEAFSRHRYSVTLVHEFQPMPSNVGGFLLLGGYAAYQWSRGRLVGLQRNPTFLLAAGCYVLGFSALRFWSDWGLPATMVLIAAELSRELMQHDNTTLTRGRLLFVAALAAAVFIVATNDTEGRWSTARLKTRFLLASDPELQGWLPERDGVLYTGEMALFYQTFYANPDANWKYILGFEPVMMPPEDLAVYQSITLNHGNPDAYLPWVRKLHGADRLVLHWPAQPNIPGVEWKNVEGTWIGRLPRQQP